ncbi:MAG TPA: DUF116 domain-containing protein [Chitinispirillaceae bacterium]|jgi:hypothetical protein|nr:DUF116 domain-containing protein [Chitinispirillaceae bacterium]
MATSNPDISIRMKNEDSAWRAAWTKLPFLAFCWASLIIMGLIELLIYYFIYPRLQLLNPLLNRLIGFSFLFFFGILFSGLFLITLTSLTGIDFLYPHNKKSVTVKLLFPIAVFLGQMFRIDRNQLRISFVKVNNSLTKAQSGRIKGDKILILLPHCLQIDICNRKITNDVNNCVRCGRCPVGSLVTLGEKYGLHIEVVNGGTLARRRVASFKPNGIVAVACERDLTLGIQDVHPIPVYGVINDRPNGPCVNTCVDMSLVEDAIKFFRKDYDNEKL